MSSELEIQTEDKLRENMEYYKRKLTDKYSRANSPSKKMSISKEVIDFSVIYHELYGCSSILNWERDFEIYQDYEDIEYKQLLKFIDNINANNDFYFNLSKNVMENFKNADYPFYKYYGKGDFFGPKLDDNKMINIIFEFLKNYNYDYYLEIKDKFRNLEILQVCLDDLLGAACEFPTINKTFILLNNNVEDNLLRYQTIIHEFGHILEMHLFQNGNNSFLINRSYETPFYEVSSSFLEYAFLNYLKDNKIYSNYVNQCIDVYFKEMLRYSFYINLISHFPELEVDDEEKICLNDKIIIKYGDAIKEKLNYYEFGKYDKKINFRTPYIYGIGKILSVYLYENYKENPNFNSEFMKSLSTYPSTSDISAFYNLGINEENLLNGDTLKKVLKKHRDEFN